MEPYDFALLGGLFAFSAIGLRSGIAATTLLALGLFGTLLVAVSIGTPDALLVLLAAWFGVAVLVAFLSGRLGWAPRNRRSRIGAVLIAAGQFAAVSVLATGSLGMRMPDGAEVLRSASAYPHIAGAGERLIAIETDLLPAPAVMLTYPAPIEAEAEAEIANTDPAARPIDWAEVAAFENRVTRFLTGHTVAADRAPISFEASGTVLRVHVELGESFAAGDILAELDPTPLQIAVDERRAGLIEADALAREANLTLDRQRQLAENGTIAQAALDRAEASAEAAQSRLAMTLAGIRSAEDRLADTLLYAPFDGIVADRMIEPAQSIQAGVPAFEIQDVNAGYQIEIVVPETLIGRIEAGAEHRAILLDGNDSPVIARVHEIGSRANATTGFPVTLDVLAATDPVRAGMTVEVQLSLPFSDLGEQRIGLAAVPYTAILPGDGERHVSFVYDPETGTLERRDITVAGREGTTTLISEGLVPGEIVATRGLPFLLDGQAVALRGVGIARYDD